MYESQGDGAGVVEDDSGISLNTKVAGLLGMDVEEFSFSDNRWEDYIFNLSYREARNLIAVLNKGEVIYG